MNKKFFLISFLFLLVISFIFNVPNEYIFIILSLFLFYLSYQMGIKKDLSWATLVNNPTKPSETDKNLGKATAIIIFIIGLVMFGIAIFLL